MATNIWTGAHASFPNEWPNADNWNTIGLTDRIPATGDNVYFESNAISCNEVMDQSDVILASLNIGQSYTGSIGTSSAPLQIGAPILNIGYHNGPGNPVGSPLLNLDLGSVLSTVTISNTGVSTSATSAPVQLKAGDTKAITAFGDAGGGKVNVASAGHGLAVGTSITIVGTTNYDGSYTIQTAGADDFTITHSSDGDDATGNWLINNILTVYKGKVAIGTGTTDVTTTFSTITVSYVSSPTTDADVFIGDLGGIITTLDMLGGSVYLEEGVTTATIQAGELITTGSGAITTLNVNGGSVISNSTGTITTLNIFDGSGVVDFTKRNTVRTVTNALLDPSGVLKLDDSVMTLSNNIKPYTADRNVTYTAS